MCWKIRLLTFGALQNAENLSHKVREIDAFLYFLESEIARCLQRAFEIEGGVLRSSPWRASEVEWGQLWERVQVPTPQRLKRSCAHSKVLLREAVEVVVLRIEVYNVEKIPHCRPRTENALPAEYEYTTNDLFSSIVPESTSYQRICRDGKMDTLMMDCERWEVEEMKQRWRLHFDGLVRAAALHVIVEIKRIKYRMTGYWIL